MNNVLPFPNPMHHPRNLTTRELVRLIDNDPGATDRERALIEALEEVHTTASENAKLLEEAGKATGAILKALRALLVDIEGDDEPTQDTVDGWYKRLDTAADGLNDIDCVPHEVDEL